MQILCVHGGISPKIKKLEDVNSVKRFLEPPMSGPICDFLWADPLDEKVFLYIYIYIFASVYIYLYED